ncbi:hypothetical protein D4764_18G0002250 [Takifugu flavidus]|uniref:Reverse transcriptase domain-containing protein n=1 Tax=Takifugu flavidus TaxID=433684 RepID=A0A5C6NS20_9TELE|nr:hypothetical protein D4764_18G0002250 [Takifugu flavidus]
MSPIPLTGLSFTSGQVRRELERLNQRKAAGPDGISPRVLKNCSRQLCGILQHLFNQSLHLQRIPVLWKTSCLVPVPKKTHPVAPSDYRPIALTSHIMKAMERLVLSHLRPLVSPFQDPLQFAYQPKSVMTSTIFSAVVCWGAGIKAKDANRLNKLIKKAGSVVGCRLDNLDEVVRDRMVLKLRTIMDSPSHPLHNTVDKLRSSFSSRLLQPRCSKERDRKSFLPSAIKLYNSS